MIKQIIFMFLLVGTCYAQSVAGSDPIKQANEWMKNNPQVKCISKIEFERLDLSEQTKIQAYGHFIISEKELPNKGEIETYEKKQSSIQTMNYDEYKLFLHQKMNATTVNSKAVFSEEIKPQAKPSIVIAPHTVTRSEYNSMTSSEKSEIDSNPTKYQIIND